MLIELVSHIDPAKAAAALHSDASGGAVTFTGTVREVANGKPVTKLVFEAYEAMALAEMQKIGARALAQWPLNAVVMQHVTGEKQVGEMVVLVGASSAHREAAFAACRFLIDELKATVPVWKKEFYTDSSVWIVAHP